MLDKAKYYFCLALLLLIAQFLWFVKYYLLLSSAFFETDHIIGTIFHNYWQNVEVQQSEAGEYVKMTYILIFIISKKIKVPTKWYSFETPIFHCNYKQNAW